MTQTEEKKHIEKNSQFGISELQTVELFNITVKK